MATDQAPNTSSSRDKLETTVPLSQGQKGLWFLYRLDPTNSAYHAPMAFRLGPETDIPALIAAFHILWRRHPLLRATFCEEEGEVRQKITERPMPDMDRVDLETLPTEQIATTVAKAADEPFDLEAGPLLRVTLFMGAAQECLLLINVHHIAVDGISYAVLLRELGLVYAAAVGGTPTGLPRLKHSYADFVDWQRNLLDGQEGQRQRDYWRQKLAGYIPAPALYLDKTQHGQHVRADRFVFFEIDGDLSRQLKAFAKTRRVNLFALFLAAYKVLLHRYSDQRDMVVCTALSGRGEIRFENLVGYFLNLVPFRTDLSGSPNFLNLIERIGETTAEALDHGDLPFPILLEQLGTQGTDLRNPLQNLCFAYQNWNQGLERHLDRPRGRHQLALEYYLPVQQAGDYQLSLEVLRVDETIDGVLKFSPDLWHTETMRRLAGHYQILLKGLIEAPRQPVSRIAMLSAEERYRLMLLWRETDTDIGQDQQIPTRIEAVVAGTPDAVALAHGGANLTYGQLNRDANRLADHLNYLGAGPGTVVAVCCEPDGVMVTALLAIHKAGAAYLPLDPELPSARLDYMLEDSAAAVLLTQTERGGPNRHKDAEVLYLDRAFSPSSPLAAHSAENPPCPSGPGDPVYIIYTSGSTGRPKGVLVPHGGLLNLINWYQHSFGLTASDRSSKLANLAFDASAWEMWPCLTAGARLELGGPELLCAPPQLRDWLVSRHITISFLPTAMAELMLALDWPKTTRLRVLQTAGEQLRRYPPLGLPFQLVNNYGPTEDSVCTTSTAIESPAGAARLPSIGKPIANKQVFLFDGHLELVPTGIPGELYIGGKGLAMGYVGRPALTAEKFVPHPFSEEAGARLYKSGDLARYLKGGDLDFLGRIDHQVKLRGYRIELGEIECHLKAFSTVVEAAAQVITIAGEDRRLVAYLVLTPGTTHEGIQEWLAQHLPGYMIPTHFVTLDALPLTPSGKVNRTALPKPQVASSSAARSTTPPSTPTEIAVSAIWAKLLGRERMAIHDNFFNLGGHSLLMARVISRLEQSLGLNLPIKALFENPTIYKLASYIDILQWTGREALEEAHAEEYEEEEIL